MKKPTRPLKKYIKFPRVLPGAFAVAVLLFFVAGPLPAAVTRLGNPFAPAGADYQIFARQGIDAAHPTGNTSFSLGPQVNAGAKNLDALAKAGNFAAGLAAIAFGGLFHLRQVRRQRKAVTVSEVHRLV